MNDSRENERLLTDILGEGTAADFREGLLNETLRLARRRRRFRQGRRAVPVLALLVGLGLLAWRFFPSGPDQPGLPARPYAVVATQPLPPAAWVATRPIAPACLVASGATANVVTTAGAGAPVREISDDDLLALAAPKAVVLVRLGPHSAELVFANPADQEALVR